ncbi:alpha/beta hydrolase [Bradyrhizobium daqingense]|uniref:Pimeloyl-ACP methyl ester carboxylesterase n=1 Tax=Bradyrhizobium daqingense TaxID=993502 RepID=A0A562L3B7_9BRAD|nr:alpha/beta hydrolase [Bradyrhizobium daqingense]TWI01954.1 pimeloyl-ACP methyl ester carboxylesterase [Bradyrhizobium daqingense]UFS88663.1 alpha/beta hydrolase [Bradyrhizobium daqingense]
MTVPHARFPRFLSNCLVALQRHPALATVAGAATLMAGAALINRQLAKKAQRDNPPQGRFIEVNGVQLHYVERGNGRPLVLFHGNGSMIQDFQSSGLIDRAAENYRVIVFDRPGFGHSLRPRNVAWTAEAQADLFKVALDRLSVHRAIVLGHSWGASVAVALAIRHPSLVEALVLASGYYFPTARSDAAASLVPAMPGLGDIISHTASPILGRLMWPAMLKNLFGPRSAPEKFAGFPREMALRPGQMRASAAEAALMVPGAFSAAKTYSELEMPTIIISGEEDRLIDINEQSARLHGEIKQSKLRRIAGVGHMIHQSAMPDLMAAIDEAAAQTVH